MTVTLEQLIEAIESSMKRMTVCVPADDYYARAGDIRTDELRYIDPEILVQVLNSMVE